MLAIHRGGASLAHTPLHPTPLQPSTGETALMVAARLGRSRVVRLLLTNYADPNFVATVSNAWVARRCQTLC